ncbi:MAG TPA: hypothetical protein DCS07_12785 [Bdellovibrionales bacterium]|nr:hypothetical protein [Bdellovibrionales bacterium]
MDELERKGLGLCSFTFGKVADKVFSTEHGWGVIHRISYYPPLMGLIAAFDNGEFQKYTLSGYREKARYDFTETQELFWDEKCTTADDARTHSSKERGIY